MRGDVLQGMTNLASKPHRTSCLLLYVLLEYSQICLVHCLWLLLCMIIGPSSCNRDQRSRVVVTENL
jgi:hypothetical protein